MPTTYTHDLFGKQVYQKLPRELRHIVKKHGDLYRIGLHGPDILFYFLVCKNPVTQLGVKMHQETARGFFTKGLVRVREDRDEALLAYMLGFGCHYLLDSACHPYIDRLHEEKAITHTLVEKELDRALMEETGRDPLHFYPSNCIVPRYAYAKVIHKVLPSVPAPLLCTSLRMMKRSTNAMVCDDGGKRRERLARIAGLTGEKHRQFILDHFMAPEAPDHSAGPVEKLKELFRQAVDEAGTYLVELAALAKEPGILSARWDKTYNG